MNNPFQPYQADSTRYESMQYRRTGKSGLKLPAISLGLSPSALIRRHLVPNALGPIIVYTTLTIPNVMLLEAFLSFLGLGIQPPQTSWGLLISYGAETMEEYPWLLIFPGIALTLTLFSLNFLGDGLRDALDVRGAKD